MPTLSNINPTVAVNACAAQLHVSDRARVDTHAIRQRFAEVHATYRQNLAEGMRPSDAITKTPKMITDSVAQHGADNRKVRDEVLRMIDCAGKATGLNPGVRSELKGMYKDATNAKSGNILGMLFGW
jgi:hypothetical protein